jgi:sugar/nucleoside kinase (ribokinase family)
VHRAAAPGPVADTVGAGDALTASYLAARLVGSSVEDALASGEAAARRAVATRGARGWSGYSRT